MDKSDKVILITGAAGTQGEAVAFKLLEAGFKVRALVFKSDASKLKDAGAEIVKGNFDEPESLIKAMEGVYGVFSMQNLDFAGDDAERRHAKNLADAALKAGVKQVVHTSVAQAGNHEKFPHWGTGRWWEKYWTDKSDAMQTIINAGFEYWTVLKPAGLMDNYIQPKANYINPHLKQGEILTAFRPETKVQVVSAEDVGSFATAAFKNSKAYHQKMIDLASEALTMTEIADIISRVTRKKVKAVHVSAEEAKAKGLFPLAVSSQEWSNEVGYNVDIEALKQYQIPLTSFEDWAQKHKNEFLIEI